MASKTSNALAKAFTEKEPELIGRWLEAQARTGGAKLSIAEKQDSEKKSRDLVKALQRASQSDGIDNLSGPAWAPVRDILSELSASRARGGYTPSETASFVFSLKGPLFDLLRAENTGDAEALARDVWQATELVDKLGLFTIEAFQKTREDLISRQQGELLELSTPVVRLWENILALPLIGTLDSGRTQIVMQNLLEAIVQTRSDYAIIDITGVPLVDTLVAQHLLKTIAAARLMGAECLISGMRPQIAQTVIHLGVDLSGVTTKATLADAFAVALRRSGHSIIKKEEKGSPEAR